MRKTIGSQIFFMFAFLVAGILRIANDEDNENPDGKEKKGDREARLLPTEGEGSRPILSIRI
jgi:hypothetical protein